MFFNDDYPCGSCPYCEVTYGRCDYDEYCRYEEEEMEQQMFYDEECDAPPSPPVPPRPSGELDDLPF